MENNISRLKIGEKEIILVATAHVSQESAELVKQVIEEENPDSVCIELDEKRFGNIQNPKAWEDTDIVSVVKSKRVGFMLVNLALSSYQKKIANQLGTQVGGEMLQAIESAQETGAQLVLADRDIQTTFARIWRKLNLWEKCKLIVSIFFSFEEEEEITEATLNEMLESDLLESTLSEMKKEFPKIGDILISERDQYLSYKIKNAPGKKVVAVLGGAHVPGIEKEIYKEADIAEITSVPPKKQIGKIIGWSIPVIIIGLFVYGFVNSVQTGVAQLLTWFIWNGGFAALFTLLVLGHPLSILTSLLLAPFTSLNPLFAVGWFSGIVQAHMQKPTVQDLHSLQTDILSFKGFFKNKALKVLLVVIMANIGSTIGTFVAGANIITNIF